MATEAEAMPIDNKKKKQPDNLLLRAAYHTYTRKRIRDAGPEAAMAPFDKWKSIHQDKY